MELTVLRVGGLAPTVTQEVLKGRFSRFGEIQELTLKGDQDKDEQSAVITLLPASEKHIQQCVGLYNKTKWLGHQLTVVVINGDKNKKNNDKKRVSLTTPESPSVRDAEKLRKRKRESDGHEESGVEEKDKTKDSPPKKKVKPAQTWQESATRHIQSVGTEPTVDFSSDDDELFDKLEVSSKAAYHFSDSESDTPDLSEWTSTNGADKDRRKVLTNGETVKKAKKTQPKEASGKSEQCSVEDLEKKGKKINSDYDISSKTQNHVVLEVQESKKEPKKKLKQDKKEDLRQHKPELRTENIPVENVNMKKKPSLLSSGVEKNTSSGSTEQLSALERNRQRVKAVKERHKESQQRKSIISDALAKMDKPHEKSQKKIVFKDSDEEDEEPCPPDTASRGLEKTSAKLHLFEDSGSSDNEEFTIKERKEFKGRKGAKLMALQSRIGMTDERFKVTSKFLNEDLTSSSSEPEDGEMEEGEDAECDVSRERERNLKILSDVMGYQVKPKPKDVIPDMNRLRVTSVANIPDPVPKQVKVTGEAAGKETKKKVKKEAQVADDPLPEVSKDKFYEFSNKLKDAFITSDRNGTFSFFDDANLYDGEEKNENSSDDENAKSGSSQDEPIKTQQSVLDKVSNDLANHRTTSGQISSSFEGAKAAFKFFLTLADPAIQEGVQNFCRKKSLDELREGWSEKRAELYGAVKKKRKMAIRRKRKDEERKSKTDSKSKFITQTKANSSRTR